MTVTEVIRLGGDTDTTAAIAGALAGVTCGPAGIPERWARGIVEQPRSVGWMLRLGAALSNGEPPPGYFRLALPLRNLVFLLAVYGHLFRRALPPY